MRSVRKRCNRCGWWESLDAECPDASGLCRRHAPKPTLSSELAVPSWSGVWPETDGADWCGEWTEDHGV
jgi:hypothetical protein